MRNRKILWAGTTLPLCGPPNRIQGSLSTRTATNRTRRCIVAAAVALFSLLSGTTAQTPQTAQAQQSVPTSSEDAPAIRRFEFERVRMGVPWKIQFYATAADEPLEIAEAVFARAKQLDQILSDYDPDSELNRLCRNAKPNQPLKVSADLFAVLQTAQKLSAQTDGAFDVTVGPITRLWRKAWRKQALPNSEELKTALSNVGYQKLKLCPAARTVQFSQRDPQLDLGAIAKGYAADEALQVFQQNGITRALVDASGDIVVGDPPPGQAGWTIGVEPLKTQAGQTPEPTEYLLLQNAAVATSGDAKRYVEIEGVRYSHIVDPRTGVGLTVSSSVTVIARSGILSDALASAFSVLPPKLRKHLLNQYQAQTLIITAEPEGLQGFESPGFDAFRTSPLE